jgi:DNA-directed RNA polymerase alpha subunit
MTSIHLQDPIFHESVDHLEDLDARIIVCLRAAGVLKFGDLVRMSEDLLCTAVDLELHEVKAIKEALAAFGLCLGQDTHGYP